MTLWENVWEQVANELPRREARARSWGSFLGAALAALVVIAIWFPIRLVAELLKAIDLTEKPDHRREAQELFREAYSLSRDLPGKSEFARSVLDHVRLPKVLHDAFFEALRNLYAESTMLEVPPIPANLDDLDGIRWRDRLRREIARMKGGTLVQMRRACLTGIEAAAASLPTIVGESEITSPLASLTNPGRFVERLVGPLDASLFPAFAERYLDNVHRISGVTRGKHARPPKLVEPHHLDDPSPFLGGTPFADILATPLGTGLPQAPRFAHHWIVAATESGKTNALQYMIAQDLERAVRGECSLVVLDSQHQLIETLSTLKLFAPGRSLDGKLCLLDAADVEYPIAINLFDMKMDRLASMSMLDRQKLMNSAFEMYEFIIGSLLQAEMTARQATLFRFVTRAMFAIPNATIMTFHDLLQNGPKAYQAHIDTLDDITRQFFAKDFTDTFRQTRDQVMARLLAVLGNETFRRMFASPRSKVDLFAEINTPGKVILINAEKGLLMEAGTELFGRFFLALINQAAAQRSTMPKEARLPCYVYVDECHNYIRNDPKIQVILAEARQQKVGVILAHQFLGQLETPVLKALTANTSIKMASRIDAADRAAMARDMNTVPDFIRDQPIGSFAVFIRGHTPSAISMHFPLDALKRFEIMTKAEKEIVRRRNRETYAERVESGSNRASESRNQENKANATRRRDPDSM